jgi:hypothetical protein
MGYRLPASNQILQMVTVLDLFRDSPLLTTNNLGRDLNGKQKSPAQGELCQKVRKDKGEVT